MTNEIHEALRTCLNISTQVREGVENRNKSELERQSLKYKKQVLQACLEHLDYLIQKQIKKEG